MTTIGDFFHQARKRMKFSIATLSQKTKIKTRYITAIENEQWHIFPSFTVARGFVHALASTVDVDPQVAIALLRRDFQEQKTSPINVSPAVVVWTPKLTLFLLVFISILLLGGYLVRQYVSYVAPPPLDVSNIQRKGNSLEVTGQTNKEASVLVNGEPVLVDDHGTFSITIIASVGESVFIEALSRSGKATQKKVVVP